jgi:hypothetical protein
MNVCAGALVVDSGLAELATKPPNKALHGTPGAFHFGFRL